MTSKQPRPTFDFFKAINDLLEQSFPGQHKFIDNYQIYGLPERSPKVFQLQTSQYNIMQQVISFLRSNKLRPFMVIYMSVVHILALIGLFYSILHRQTIFKVTAFHILFHLAYALGITGGAHRLWAHKAYTATAPLRFFLMLLCSGANQGSVIHWSRDHRLHHKFSDTLLDPYSIQRGIFFAHMGWLLKQKTPELVAEGSRIDLQDMEKDWVLVFQKNMNWLLTPLMCFILPAFCFSQITQANFFICLCLALMPYVTLLHATWCVNSICHKYGTRPWNKEIAPADNIWVSLITNGEGYHNWHHEYPSDWRASNNHWYMLNLTARFLQVCSLFRLCKLKM